MLMNYTLEDFRQTPLYRDRENWKDITPLPQTVNDEPNLINIKYSEKFKDAHDYMRVVIVNKEISQRALLLTTDCLLLNPANYTTWHYRKLLLDNLKLSWESELDFTRHLIERNSKNYQLWHHRELALLKLNFVPQDELNFVALVLKEDSKNYHAWQHRLWIIKKYSLLDDEMNFTLKLIQEDVRNNSAWNHRFYIVAQSATNDKDILYKEMEFTKEMIIFDVENESSWNYLRGIISDATIQANTPISELQSFCQNLYDNSPKDQFTNLSFLLSFQIHLYEYQLNELQKSNIVSAGGDFKNSDQKDGVNSTTKLKDIENIKAQIVEICQNLAKEYDYIRRNYWNMIAQQYKNPDDNLK